MITEELMQAIRVAVKKLQELVEESKCDHEKIINDCWHPEDHESRGIITLICGQCGERLK